MATMTIKASELAYKCAVKVQRIKDSRPASVEKHIDKLMEEEYTVLGFFGPYKRFKTREDALKYLKRPDFFGSVYDQIMYSGYDTIEYLQRLEKMAYEADGYVTITDKELEMLR